MVFYGPGRIKFLKFFLWDQNDALSFGNSHSYFWDHISDFSGVNIRRGTRAKPRTPLHNGRPGRGAFFDGGAGVDDRGVTGWGLYIDVYILS
ncbi:hypothetical protein D9M68_786300 [compost metagenome]